MRNAFVWLASAFGRGGFGGVFGRAGASGGGARAAADRLMLVIVPLEALLKAIGALNARGTFNIPVGRCQASSGLLCRSRSPLATDDSIASL